MLELIVCIYAGICWLIFKKFELLPWNFKTQVVVFSIPIFGVIYLILSLNYYTPITSDIRVINRSVDINPQILGRVKKVYVKTNQEVKKGDTLFTLDPEPYRQEIKALEAKIKTYESSLESGNVGLNAAAQNVRSIQSQLNLANTRVAQLQELVAGGAANRFDLEQAQTNAQDLEGRLAAAQLQLESTRIQLNSDYEGDNSGRAEILAKLAQARWNLEQTVILAPSDGTIPNVQINEGSMLSPLKSAFVMIRKEQSIVGLFAQNELEAVKPGDEVEVALRTEPGAVIKAKLEYVIDATSQGILNNASGMMGTTAGLPDTSRPYPEYEGKLAAKFILEDPNVVLTTGARGSATIYSEHFKPLHIVRKVMVRINSKLNYIIPKLH